MKRSFSSMSVELRKKQMNIKYAILVAGLVAGSLAATAQTADTPAADAGANMTAAEATASNPAPASAETNAPAVTSTNMAETESAAPTNAAAMESTNSAAMDATNAAALEPLPEGSAPTMAGATEGETNEAVAAVIPLIVMDDVPLTDAIKNLARQAGLNYMLDPKINYGQMGPDGRIIPQPSVSIRWENVTAEQALTALLNNWHLQMVEDTKTKIVRITVKDPAAPDPLFTRIFQLKFANPTNVVNAVETAFADRRRSRVVPDVRTSQLIVVATEKEMDSVENIIKDLDTAPRQVLIEARLLETSISPSSIKGLNWSGTLQAQQLNFGNNLQENKPADSLNNTLSQSFPNLLVDTAHGFNPATAFLDASGVSAVLSFINQNSEAKVLSEPRTVTLDNEQAHIEVGQNYPIINVTAGTANTTGGSQITYSNLTVKLDVTPRISANNFINLKVSPHVLRLDHVQTFVIGGQPFDVPIFDTRTLDTSVMIPSGNTLVMGGLVQDNQVTTTTKVPLFGDLPVIGNAFRSKDKSRQKNNLLVFITPTIVQDSDYQPTATDYLKTPVPKPDDSKWSAWDSTTPLDWSKPIGKQFHSTPGIDSANQGN
jgi:type II secretory pathway component GspD/PulD (secretin)